MIIVGVKILLSTNKYIELLLNCYEIQCKNKKIHIKENKKLIVIIKMSTYSIVLFNIRKIVGIIIDMDFFILFVAFKEDRILSKAACWDVGWCNACLLPTYHWWIWSRRNFDHITIIYIVDSWYSFISTLQEKH